MDESITVSNIYHHVSYSTKKHDDDEPDYLKVSWDDSNIILDKLIERELCPLFYKRHATIDEYGEITTHIGSEMSQTELYELHTLANSNQEYDIDKILNHGWVEKFKEVAGWEPGREIIFGFAMFGCEQNSFYIRPVKDYRRSQKYKIDADGFFCAQLPMPNHWGRYYPIQRVVCRYNLLVEEESNIYVLK